MRIAGSVKTTCQYTKHCSKILPAFTNFDRFGLAVIMGRSKQSPCSLGAVPKQAKTFFPRIPLVSTIKQRPDFRGFFASAVLSTIASASNRMAEKKTVSVAFNARCNSYNPMDWLQTQVRGLMKISMGFCFGRVNSLLSFVG